MSLSSAVASADAAHVVEGGKRLGTSNPDFAFLDNANPLIAQNAQEYIENSIRRGLTAGDTPRLEEFLALASACHLFSGWRYLGKAAYSALDAARSVSIHMAYYAELRAAMSLLASAGIGMLNTCHFAIDTKGSVAVFGGLNENKKANLPARSPKKKLGTHVAVWDAMKHWCQRPDVSTMLLRQLKVLGRSGDTWVRACSGSSSLPVPWAADWSVDLKKLRGDSSLRNTASYQIDLGRNAYAAVEGDEIGFIRMLGLASVSDSPGDLSGIDLALARDLMCKAGDNAKMSRSDLWDAITQFLILHESLAEEHAEEEAQQLRGADSTAGGKIVKMADPQNETLTGVISRAFLLLRLATLVVRNQWLEIRQVSPQGEAPWQRAMLKQIAENCHLQLPDDTDDPAFGDFITDHADAVDEVETWCNDNTVTGFGLWDRRNGVLPALRDVCLLERVGLWGMAP